MRQLWVALVIGSIPIILAPIIGASLFPDSVGRQFNRGVEPGDSNYGAAVAPGSNSVTDDSEGNQEGRTDWLAVRSDPALDPGPDSDFLLIIRLQPQSLPKVGKRQRLIRKYGPIDGRMTGWALALKRFDTSVRPELFLNDSAGHGEWYTFDEIQLKKGEWVQIFVVRRKDGSLGMFYQHESGDDQSIRSLGGYDTAEVNIKDNNADLMFVPLNVDNGEFRGELSDIMIATPEKLPRSESKMVALFTDNVNSIDSIVAAEQVRLLVRADGRDHSQYKRPITAKTDE